MSHAYASYRNRHATVRDFTRDGVALVQKAKDRRYCPRHNSLDIHDIAILRHVYQRSQQLRVLRHVVSKSRASRREEARPRLYSYISLQDKTAVRHCGLFLHATVAQTDRVHHRCVRGIPAAEFTQRL